MSSISIVSFKNKLTDKYMLSVFHNYFCVRPKSRRYCKRFLLTVFVHMSAFKLLSKVYHGSKKKLLFRCPNGHTFGRCPMIIVSHHVFTCPRCKRLNNHKQHLLNLKQYARSHYHGYKILRVFYGKYQEYYITMKCPRGHVFTRPSYKVKNHLLCPYCRKRHISLQKSHRYLKKYKRILLKKLYKHHLHLITILPTRNHVPFSKHRAIIKCNHHHVFERIINTVIMNTTCPYCIRAKGHYHYYLRFKHFLTKDLPKYSLIYAPKYLISASHIILQCPKGHIFSTKPINIISGNGCPICCASKGERLFRLLLIKHKIPYVYGDTDTLGDCSNLHLDFTIPGKCAVEIDGDYHFCLVFTSVWSKAHQIHHLRSQQYRDELKDKLCFKKHIPLIRVLYVEGTNRRAYIKHAFKWLYQRNFNLPDGITYLY